MWNSIQSPGEARLQQWGSRDTNHHYVHAHCINGGLGHDHELFPKQAADQHAVDIVTRQRDTITRTAADTEVLTPFCSQDRGTSLYSSVHPTIERDLFGREEALRMDEEIMDFQWFEHVTWDSIKDQCEARRTSNLPRGSDLRCSRPNMLSFELSFTTTQPLQPQNQPGKCWCSAAGSSWDDLQSMLLRATVLTIWMRGWSLFFGLKIGQLFGPWVRAECDVAPVQNTTRRTDKQQTQSRIRKVATLARTVEKGRALAAARNAPPLSSHRTNCSRDQEPQSWRIQNHRHLCQATISALFLSEVAEHVPTTLRKMPRLSEPGPLGMRAEHWYDFGSLAGNSELFRASNCAHSCSCRSQLSVTILKSWTDHTACQNPQPATDHFS